MNTTDMAAVLAADWINAWNSHNIDAILAHYDENITFSSPLVAAILAKADGTLQGKTALRAYFLKGLATYPELKFELYRVLAGINSVVIYYKSVKNLVAAEVMILNGQGKIQQCLCNYTEV